MTERHSADDSAALHLSHAQTETVAPVEMSFWLKFFLVVFVVLAAVSYIHQSCMTGFQISPIPTDQFNGLNARVHLQKVTSFFPRTAGSIANEILAPGYLRQVLSDVVVRADRSGLKAVFNEQISQYSSFQSHFHVTSYQNLRNFLLRLHDPRFANLTSPRTAFLVNCHYDSALNSPGASDAFVSCAIMLEIARVLASGNVRMLNDIIFLFNGAEESILPSSHAFITQHPWAADIAAFLNLEGVGAGGRLLVFQTGPGEAAELLLNTYSQAFNQPSGQVLAEELFQSGFILSDTDFRVFRDYGLIPGIDMAYTTDGYCYHTPYDTESRITPDCLQKAGEDVLSFLTIVARDPDLSSISKLSPLNGTSFVNRDAVIGLSSDAVSASMLPGPKVHTMSQTRQVYFDILGLKMFVVPWWLWRLLNWSFFTGLCFVSFYHRGFACNQWGALIFAVLLQLAGQLIGVLFAYVLGSVVRSYGCRMTWYSLRHNLIGIFVLPFLCWNVWFCTFFSRVSGGFMNKVPLIRSFCSRIHWRSGARTRFTLLERDFFDAAIFILSFLSIILDIFNSRAVYIITMWLGIVAFGRFVCHILFLSNFASVEQLLIMLLPILICHVNMCMSLLDFLIPLMGRVGQTLYPDVLLSVCTYFLLLPIFLFLAGPLQCTSSSCGRTLRLLLTNACLSYAILVHASPYGFPYTVTSNTFLHDPSISPRYQRVGVFHGDRRFRFHHDSVNVSHSDSHVWIIPLDDNGVRYLKPGSYPASVPSSLLSVIFRTERHSPSTSRGLVELLNTTSTMCNVSLPYCGFVAVYPHIHRIKEFFHVSTQAHDSKPDVKLHLLSRVPVECHRSADRRCWNFTFSVLSGPPNTQILLRFDVPQVRMAAWSFNSEMNIPMPVPLPKADKVVDQHAGAHYFIYHVNAAAVNASAYLWDTPWTFWFIVDAITSSESVPYFDLATASVYTDESLPSASSPQMRDILSRLPPWTVPLTAITSYDHYRLVLK